MICARLQIGKNEKPPVILPCRSFYSRGAVLAFSNLGYPTSRRPIRKVLVEEEQYVFGPGNMVTLDNQHCIRVGCAAHLFRATDLKHEHQDRE
jgi:hypothetical protein